MGLPELCPPHPHGPLHLHVFLIKELMEGTAVLSRFIIIPPSELRKRRGLKGTVALTGEKVQFSGGNGISGYV